MKLVNPFTKYTLAQWSSAYVKAILYIVLVLTGAPRLGSGLCAEPLAIDAICESDAVRQLVRFVFDSIGEAAHYIVKLAVLAYLIRVLVACWMYLRGGKKSAKASAKKRK